MNINTVFRVLLVAAIVALVGIGIAPVAAEEINTPAYVPDHVIIIFDEDVDSTDFIASTPVSEELLMDISSLVPGLQVLQLPEGFTVEEAIAYYSQFPGVISVEPDYYVSIASQPNDPDYSKLWGLNNLSALGGASAEPAWDITTGDDSIIVAVLDTGADISHPDLQDHIWTNQAEYFGQPGVDDDGNGYVDDIHGWNFFVNSPNVMDYQSHGTHCAGIIGAVANNGIGVAGTAWNVTIMPVAVFPAAGNGPEASIFQGINYAVSNGADIISMSFGGGGAYNEAYHRAINATEEAGVVVVAAAGNNGVDNDQTPMWPASFPNNNIIAIAASNQTNERAYFSCYGETSVDLAAPGVDIFSTVPEVSTEPGTLDPVTANKTEFGQLGAPWSVETPFGPRQFLSIHGSNSSVLYYNDPLTPAGEQFSLSWYAAYFNLTPGQSLQYLVSTRNFSEYGSVENMLAHQSDWLLFAYNTHTDYEYPEQWSVLWSNIQNLLPSDKYYVGIYYNSTNATSNFYLLTTTIGNNYTLAGHGYESKDGTSMATPMVSGAVALVKSVNPDLTPSEIRELLISTVDKFDAWTGKVVSGGRLNITAAVLAAFPAEIVETGIRYKSVADAFDAVDATNKTIRLLRDSILTDEIVVGTEVILDLNGTNLTAAPNQRLFIVSSIGNLTVTSSASDGKLIGNGEVSANDLNGNGGGIYLCADGILTLSGDVNLTGCAAANCGGGVYLDNNGTLTISGDVQITGCAAGDCGGGVYVGNNGALTISEDVQITGCAAANCGGGVYVEYNSMFTMNGGNIDGNTATRGAGVCDTGNFSISGDAEISADNDLMLYCDYGTYYHNVTVITPFTGQIGAITLYDEDSTENPSVWVNQIIAVNGSSALANIALASSDRYKGFQLGEDNDDIILNVSSANVTASGGVAAFGNDNYTVVDATQSTISKILLKDVSQVKDEPVGFIAGNTTVPPTPSVAGYTKQEISVFEINATANGTSRFNLTVTFEDAGAASANKNNVWFFHYTTANAKWDDNRLSSSIVDDDGVNITYQVETESFSPFCSIIFTPNPQSSPSSGSSSRHSGGSILLQPGETAPTVDTPTAEPTIAPTAVATPVPTADTPSTPVASSTTQPTQKSPAPLVGLIAGLGAAGVLVKARK